MKEDPTVAAVLARDLARYGARRCFGLLGTANFRISHALVEAGVELVSARHECNAASMADAYAKATQELTLVSVHSGPGLTNALTGIGEAAKSRTPLLVLAGDVPTGAVKSNFYVDQAEMVRSVGADLGAHPHAGLGARGHAARGRPSAARPPDGGVEPADRCAGRAARRQGRPARAAAGSGAAASQSRGVYAGWPMRFRAPSARSFSPVAARCLPVQRRS